MKITGKTGQLTAGGRQVVDLMNYTLTQQGGGWQCEAEVVTYNPYWLQHAPELALRVDVGSQEWIWRKVIPTIGAGQLSVPLTGEPEKVNRNGKVQICESEYRQFGIVRR